MNEESLFAEALERTPGTDREKYLAEVCGGDLELRKRLEELLAADERTTGLLDGISISNEPALESRTPGSTSVTPVAVGTIIAGRYRLIELIGEGGMGDVYVAEQSEPVRRKVALKLIKSGLDSRNVLARFEQERQALAVMDHPHIAKVFDGGVTEHGRPYFVMEYIKGVPITEYCDRVSMPIRQRLKLFEAACHAVQHAHQKGIIHRDLKPSNILVALYDGKPVTKVIDFGLAKLTDQPLTDRILDTGHAVVMGTPLYMSPEQASLNNLDIDTRSDVYSLGVVLYELLTGSTPIDREPFQKMAWDEALRQVREVDPPTPSSRLMSADGLPNLAALRQQEPGRLPRLVQGELDWIVMKALEKDRSRRYDSASTLASDISNFLNDDPVVACPPSMTYRLRKFVRRNRLAFSTLGLVFAALALGFLGITWQAIRAARAEATAIAERDRTDSARREAVANAETAIAQRKIAEAAAVSERKAREEESQQRQAANAARELAELHRQNAEVEFRRAINSMSLLVQSLYDKDTFRLPSRLDISDKCARRVRSFLETVVEQADSSYDGELRRGLTYIHLTRIAAAMRNEKQCRVYFGLANTSFQKLVDNYPNDPVPIIELAQSHYICGLHHWAHGEVFIAKERFQNAADAFRAANELDPHLKRAACLRAYFLVTCPDAEMQAPDVALELVVPWMSTEPSDNSTFINFVSSCAMYRLDDWKKALQFAAHTVSEREGEEYYQLVSAMAHWKLGEQDLARGILRDFVVKRESGNWSYDEGDSIWSETSALLELPELGPPTR